MKTLSSMLVVLALAGCGGSGTADTAPTTGPASAGAAVPGGGLSVTEALASDLDGPLLVKGYLVERDGEVRLCEAILESSPPQCGEPSLLVEGRAPAASAEPASILGEVEGGTIAVSETATG